MKLEKGNAYTMGDLEFYGSIAFFIAIALIITYTFLKIIGIY